MSYRHTLEAAVESLHEIEDLVKGLPAEGKIPSIEIDLALQKLRNIYELLLLLKGRDEMVPGEPEIQKTSAVIVVEESKTTTVEVSSVEESKPPEKSDKNPDEPIIEERFEKKVTTSRKTSAGIQTLADQFKGRPTLLESLNQTYTKVEDTLAHTKPISDLMSAIALNDRFTFIRELFNNDKKAFETAISTLNNAGDFDSAYDYMTQQFNWDMEDEPVQMLLSIIRRKYIKGRYE